MQPMSWKRTRKTQSPIITAMLREERTCRDRITAATPKRAF
jgi:hypothetical protein